MDVISKLHHSRRVFATTGKRASEYFYIVGWSNHLKTVLGSSLQCISIQRLPIQHQYFSPKWIFIRCAGLAELVKQRTLYYSSFCAILKLQIRISNHRLNKAKISKAGYTYPLNLDFPFTFETLFTELSQYSYQL